MSTNDRRSAADYSSLDDAQVRSVRRDAEDDEQISTIGYVPGSQRARAFPGDDKFPFVKDVPDVVGPLEYRKSFVGTGPTNPLPLATSVSQYDTGAAIDVRGQRTLVLMGAYLSGVSLAGAAEGLLSVVCEASLAPFTPSQTFGTLDVWFPIGVVDPTLTTPAIEPGFAYRRFYSSEFRFDPLINQPAPHVGPVSSLWTLVFDVSGYRQIRFRTADLVSAAAFLDLRYYFQR